MNDADSARRVEETRAEGPLDAEALTVLARSNTASEAADELGRALPLRWGQVPPELFHRAVTEPAEEPGQ